MAPRGERCRPQDDGLRPGLLMERSVGQSPTGTSADHSLLRKTCVRVRVCVCVCVCVCACKYCPYTRYNLKT